MYVRSFLFVRPYNSCTHASISEVDHCESQISSPDQLSSCIIITLPKPNSRQPRPISITTILFKGTNADIERPSLEFHLCARFNLRAVLFLHFQNAILDNHNVSERQLMLLDETYEKQQLRFRNYVILIFEFLQLFCSGTGHCYSLTFR